MITLDRLIAFLTAKGFKADPKTIKLTSPETPTYNCIAWAASDQTRWWWPDPGQFYYWPADIPREDTLAAFKKAFETLGYHECENGDCEPGFEKVALYLKDGVPTHASRQLGDGSWTSKLGKEVDISHSIDDICGGSYGQPEVFLKRLAHGSPKPSP